MCKVCSSLGQKWGNERAIMGIKIILTCSLKDIPYNGDSHEISDMVHVKYVLPKGAFMSKTVATFVQNVGLIFTSIIQDTNVIVGLKLLTTGTKVTTVLCAQGKKSDLVQISLNRDRRSSKYIQAPLRNKPRH